MPVATTLTVTPATVALSSLGETRQLTAAVRDQNGDPLSGSAVTWSSTTTSVATVSSSGLVTAVGVGSATITGASGSASGTVSVSVAQVAAAVVVSQAALTLAGPGDEATVTATVEDARGSDITAAVVSWSSDDAGVATIDAAGLVTGVSAGTTTLTAQGSSGGQTVSETVSVTVEDAAPVTPAGGDVNPAPNVRVTLPAGAVGGTVFVTARPAVGLPALPVAAAGTAFDFGPDGIVFAQPVTLSITYDPANVPAGVSESELRIHKVVSGDYVLVDAGSVDVVNHVVTGTVNGFSVYAVVPRLSVVSTELPNGVAGVPYNAGPLTATGEGESTSWALAEGSGPLPGGLSLGEDGSITGTPTTVGTFEFTVEATSGTRSAQRALSVTIQPSLAVTTTELPAGAQGQTYGPHALIATSEGGAWTLASGSGPLPDGLSLSGAGEIAGTPTAAGTFAFTVEVTIGTQSAQQALSITVHPALSVTTTSLPDGVEDEVYGTQTLTATGGDGSLSWALAAGSGPLPTGLSLAANGEITGTPTAGGTFDFTVEATSGTQTAEQALSITVIGTLAVATTTLPDGVEDVDYGTETLAATGGEGGNTWALAAGSGPLPDGLSLAANGDITGTPTVPGTFDFTVEVESGSQTAEQALSITVHPTLTVTTMVLADGLENQDYGTVTLAATGGDGTLMWALATGSGPLPTGLSLAANGDITGTPTAAGTFDFTVEATSGTQTDEQALSITVQAALAVTTTTLPDGVEDVDYGTETLAATGGGGGNTWALAAGSDPLPDGLSLAGNGDITGTPTVPGTFDFTVEVTSGAQTAAQALSITVHPTLTITTTVLADGAENQDYGTVTLAATGGDGTLAWALAAGSGPLPDGLSLAANGDITGTPTAAGTFDFTVEATSGTQTDAQALAITIHPELSVTTTTLPDGVEDVDYGTVMLAATGGEGGNTWALAAGSDPLPDGLSLAANGDITGTPTVPGTFDFTVEVVSGIQTAAADLSITVHGTLVVTTTTLPDGDLDVDYGTETLAATGGDGTLVWSLATGSDPLPDGLSLAANGDITGTPTTLGTFDFTVEVTSGSQADEQLLSITVDRLVLLPADLCSASPGSAIATFADAALEGQVRTELGLVPADLLTCDVLSGLTDLTVEALGVTSLVGMQNASGLQTATFRANPISDITPLAGLTTLVDLTVGDAPLSDISPLAGLVNLTTLFIDGNSIVDITPLDGLTSLQTLSLLGNEITDIAPLEFLTDLAVVVLSGNANLVDITALINNTGISGSGDFVVIQGTMVTCEDITTLRVVNGVTVQSDPGCPPPAPE